jgi:hypothetical protein
LGVNQLAINEFGSDEHFSNGYFYLVPVNHLTSPDNSNVRINLYIKSDNMHFNQLTVDGMPLRRTILAEGKHLSQTPPTVFDLNESSASDKDICSLNFGEEVFSLRTVLKRFNTIYSASLTSGTGTTCSSLSINNVPIFDPTIALSSVSTYKTFIGYLRPAFFGFRGSVRMKVRKFPVASTDVSHSTVVTKNEPATYAANSWTNSSTLTDIHNRPSGSMQYYQLSNNSVEFEAPFYSLNSYVYACNDKLALDSNFADAGTFFTIWNRKTTVGFSSINSSAGTYPVLVDWALGEDGCLMRFLAAPFFTAS